MSTLTEDGAITGTVTDAQTNSLLSGVTVTCGGGCPSGMTTTDGSGDYAFTMVPTGSAYSLTFTASGYVTQTITGVTVTAPNTTSENVALTEDGGVSGVVTDASTHAAIPNATVTCTCRVGSVTTNSSGAYSFTQIVPGSYTASVAATSYVGQTSNPFTVSPGGTTTQNFQLSAIPKAAAGGQDLRRGRHDGEYARCRRRRVSPRAPVTFSWSPSRTAAVR